MDETASTLALLRASAVFISLLVLSGRRSLPAESTREPWEPWLTEFLDDEGAGVDDFLVLLLGGRWLGGAA